MCLVTMRRLCLRLARSAVVLTLVFGVSRIVQSVVNRLAVVPTERTPELVHVTRAPVILPQCHFSTSQHTPVNKTAPTWQQLDKQFPMLEAGGQYKPPNCRATQNIAIIIPYRNREEHLKLFLQHMHPFLQAQQLEYTIYVVELEKDVIFKKGLLMNAGFLESSKQNDTHCFVFHDVDMIPLNASISYTCKPKNVKHPSHYIRQYNFKVNYREYLGGVLIFHKDDFRKVNGFSNLYWGWGGEDDDMYYRLKKQRIPIKNPTSSALLYESWSHKHEVEFINRRQFIAKAAERMHEDGLNSAKYTVLHTEKRHLYTWIYVSANQTDGSYKHLQPEHGPNTKDEPTNASTRV